MSSRTTDRRQPVYAHAPPAPPNSPPKLRKSSRDNRPSGRQRRTNGVTAPLKSRQEPQWRDETPKSRNNTQPVEISSSHDAYVSSNRDVFSSRNRREDGHKQVEKQDDAPADYDSEDSFPETVSSAASASSGTYSSDGYSSAFGGVDDNDDHTAEDQYSRSIATAQRKMRQDDYGVVKPGVGAGWPKKSLLAAASPRIEGTSSTSQSRRVGGQVAGASSAAAKHNGTALSLKHARATATARRSRTAKKLQEKKEWEKQLTEPYPIPASTTRTPNKSITKDRDAPSTPLTLDTTMSSSASADLSPPLCPPEPSKAKAYNRFFPPKLAEGLETSDGLGADNVLSLEPNTATGEIEIYTEEKYYTTTTSPKPSYESYGASQWAAISELAKKECEGPNAEKQKEQQYDVDREDLFSQASVPTVLNNGDVFHESATQAVTSLLSVPHHKRKGNRGDSNGNDDDDSVAASANSTYSSFSTYSAVSTPDGDDNAPAGPPLISKETESFVDTIPLRMAQPSKKLYDLIAVIHTNNEDEASSQPLTTAAKRGMMTRRMNACGALKVMAAKSAANCVRLAWTGGVLSSLTSVLADSSINYVDKATYQAYTVARERAIAALVPMSASAENRILMLHFPGLVHSVIKTIDEDDGSCGLGCFAILMHLSKAVENRLLLANTPGLLEAFLAVVRFKEDRYSPVDDSIDNLIGDLGGSSPSKVVHGARANAFAILLNLSKEKDNAYHIARNKELLDTIVQMSKLHKSVLHTPALAILLHLTRHRDNAKLLVLDTKGLLSALVIGMGSPDANARRHAVRAIQNLSSRRSCRPHISPNTSGLIKRLCKIALGNACVGENEDDGAIRHAAVGTLNNLADDPSNLIPMTDAPECFSTLMLIAHGGDTSITPVMAMMAKDALAALSEWLRKVATKATSDKSNESNQTLCDSSIPTFTYKQWV